MDTRILPPVDTFPGLDTLDTLDDTISMRPAPSGCGCWAAHDDVRPEHGAQCGWCGTWRPPLTRPAPLPPVAPAPLSWRALILASLSRATRYLTRSARTLAPACAQCDALPWQSDPYAASRARLVAHARHGTAR